MTNISRAQIEDEAQVFNLFSKLTSRQRSDDYRVDQESGHKVYHKILNNPDLGIILVAKINTHVVGVITLSYPVAIRCSGSYARIEEYIVDEKYRGQGIGTMLLEAALKAARDMDCYDIQVNNPSNLGRPLYLKQGFMNAGDYMRLKL